MNKAEENRVHFFQHILNGLAQSPNQTDLDFAINVLQRTKINMCFKDFTETPLFSYLWRLQGYGGFVIRTKVIHGIFRKFKL